MVTILAIVLVFLFFVLYIPLGLTVQRWLFQQRDEVVDPEWELYQQRYD